MKTDSIKTQNLSAVKPEDTFVYVMAHSGDGIAMRAPVKIGISDNPKKRLSQIKTASPYPVVIVAAFPMPGREFAVAAEKCFHKVYRPARMNGEWFDLRPDEAVEAMCINIREMLRVWLEFDDEFISEILDKIGVVAFENALAEARA